MSEMLSQNQNPGEIQSVPEGSLAPLAGSEALASRPADGMDAPDS